MLFVDIRIGESGFESKRWSLADPLHRRCAAELSALPRADPMVDARTHSRIRARWFGPGTESVRPRFEREMQQATGLVAQGPHENVSDPADFVSGHAALRFWGGRRACCFNSSCSSGRRSRRRSWCARLRRGARGRFLCAATTKPGITRVTNRLAAEGRQIGLDPILVAAGPARSAIALTAPDSTGLLL